MQLIGQDVRHEKFGNGVVSDYSDRFVVVEFKDCKKKFLYPQAFNDFLTLSDENAQIEITAKYKKTLEKKRIKAEEKQEQKEKLQRLAGLSITKQSQAVFNLKEDEIEAVFGMGQAFSGNYLSGNSKGEPKIPNRMRPNTACLLTYIPEGSDEKQRTIAGIFMVNEDFFGTRCYDGIIKAHPIYRLDIPENLRLPYYDLIEKKESSRAWGSAAFKYIDNYTMKAIVKAISDSLAGTDFEKDSKEFYDYYLLLNHFPKE